MSAGVRLWSHDAACAWLSLKLCPTQYAYLGRAIRECRQLTWPPNCGAIQLLNMCTLSHMPRHMPAVKARQFADTRLRAQGFEQGAEHTQGHSPIKHPRQQHKLLSPLCLKFLQTLHELFHCFIIVKQSSCLMYFWHRNGLDLLACPVDLCSLAIRPSVLLLMAAAHAIACVCL